MNKTESKHTGLILAIILVVSVSVFLYMLNLNKNTFLRYKKECGQMAIDFLTRNNKDSPVVSWALIQNKFISEDNSCYAEYGFGQIGYIYNLTTNKNIAIMPAPVNGDETSTIRIELIKQFNEVKNKIFSEN